MFQFITGMIMNHPLILQAKSIAINDKRIEDIYGKNIVFGL
jgi:hypothetical protein